LSIAQEIKEALVSVANDLEGASFLVTVTRADNAETPWGAGTPETFPNVTAFDKGEEELTPRGSSTPVSMRVLLLPAVDNYSPEYDDSITLGGREYKAKHIETVAPVGVDYMYRVGFAD